MRVLVTGAGGLLGYDIVRALIEREWVCAGCGRSAAYPGLRAQLESGLYSYTPLDICDGPAVDALIRSFRPDAVIHCAAWRDAVSAERPENEAAVFAVNALATRRLAEACAAAGSKMVYVSTDYVFNGSGSVPWPADGAALLPLNVYGRSKLAGEQAAAEALSALYTVRTAWLFGVHGGSFVRAMLRLGAEKKELTVVDDQIGTPTYTRDLARLLADMAGAETYGVYHAAGGGGYVSRYAFAEEIFRQAGMPVRLIPAHTADFPGDPVPRPLNGRLELSKLAANGFEPLPCWKDALSRCLKEMEYHG